MTLRRRQPLVLALSFTLLGLAACKSSIDDKPKAKVEDAEPVDKGDKGDKADEGDKADAGAAAADAGDALTLSAEDSKIGFIGAKAVGEHSGSFTKFSGSATLKDGEIGAVEIVVEMDSLTTDVEPKLTAHLKGADFFEVETYPQAKFTSLSITEKPGDDGATHEVAGNLELKGQAKKVTFPATLELSDGGAHGKAAFSIDRKLWGIDYAGQADNLIKDEVALTLDLQFK